MRGAKADLKGVDVNVAFGERTSSSTYRSFGFGAALLGAPGSGKLYLGALKKDMGGLVFHASVNKHYFSGGEKIPVWQFLTSIPFSVGNFTVGNSSKEEVTVYNFLVGAQAGAAMNIKTGNFVMTPSMMLSVLGGYREKYKGGTYWDNLNSGGVSPFTVMTLGADLAHVPGAARLSGIYQRTSGSGHNRAIDSVMIRLAFAFAGC